jgi:hypothetical protein
LNRTQEVTNESTSDADGAATASDRANPDGSPGVPGNIAE